MAKPLNTCSLLVEQHGDVLLLLFHHLAKPEDPNSKTLFAQAKIDLSSNKQPDGAGKKKLSLEYFVESVVDSSRYFVVRIVDEKSGREARIGFGFRDREEATDFRESLQYYIKSVKRDEEAAEVMHHIAEGADLSLKDGEKIHINVPGKGGSGFKSTITKEKDKSATDVTSPGGTKKAVPLLKKPPAAPKLNPDISISFGDMDIHDAVPDAKSDASSSNEAVGGVSSEGDDDDIFGEFEGVDDESEAKPPAT